jgi:hypothetical protein
VITLDKDAEGDDTERTGSCAAQATTGLRPPAH